MIFLGFLFGIVVGWLLFRVRTFDDSKQRWCPLSLGPCLYIRNEMGTWDRARVVPDAVLSPAWDGIHLKYVTLGKNITPEQRGW
jgi:hypothetical protein